MEIKVSIEGDTKVFRDLRKSTDEVKEGAWRSLRATAFALSKRIKREMPRDTGRAAASWARWSPSFITENEEASRDDVVWEEDEDDLTITQGTNVSYVKKLNEGSSRQAPRGFLEKAADAAQSALLSRVSKAIDRAIK